MTTFDIDWVRSQFPALAMKVNGYPAAFFDGPGGTQVPQRVIDAMGGYLATSNANTHGAFATSRRTDEVIAAAHAAMADLLGCDPEEIVFGPNMTTLTFALSRALGRDLEPGDEIVVTRLDHDANVSPWTALEERGCVIRFVDIHPADCTLDMEELRRAVTPRTRVVAVGYASNSVGTINDVEEVVRAGACRGRHGVYRCGPLRAARTHRRAKSGLRFSGLFPVQVFRSALRRALWKARAPAAPATLQGAACDAIAFPAAGRRERRTTRVWRESPPPWNTWRNSGDAISLRCKAKGQHCWRPTTPFALYERSLLEQLVPALTRNSWVDLLRHHRALHAFTNAFPPWRCASPAAHRANWQRISASAACSRGTATTTR